MVLFSKSSETEKQNIQHKIIYNDELYINIHNNTVNSYLLEFIQLYKQNIEQFYLLNTFNTTFKEKSAKIN